jgi:hypothetical protein
VHISQNERPKCRRDPPICNWTLCNEGKAAVNSLLKNAYASVVCSRSATRCTYTECCRPRVMYVDEQELALIDRGAPSCMPERCKNPSECRALNDFR